MNRRTVFVWILFSGFFMLFYRNRYYEYSEYILNKYKINLNFPL